MKKKELQMNNSVRKQKFAHWNQCL